MKLCRSLLIMIVAFIPMVGCKTNKPTKDQLVGVWRMQARDHLTANVGGDIPSFSLGSDGSLIASALPIGLVRIDGLGAKRWVSGTGSWSLEDSSTEVRVLLTFKTIKGSTGQGLPYGAEFFPQRSASGVRLYYFEGDPDEDQRIYFDRVSNKPS